jgi:hypothetical protein
MAEAFSFEKFLSKLEATVFAPPERLGRETVRSLSLKA